MRVELDHGCGRVHHSFPGLAACIWPDAGYCVGDGGHALVAHCDIESVSLYPTRAQAERHLAELDTNGCGRSCTGDHAVVSMVSALVGAAHRP